MSFEYTVVTASISRQSIESGEKKASKPTESTVGLQILVHLNIDAESIAEASKDFKDPLDVNKKTELATVV